MDMTNLGLLISENLLWVELSWTQTTMHSPVTNNQSVIGGGGDSCQSRRAQECVVASMGRKFSSLREYNLCWCDIPSTAMGLATHSHLIPRTQSILVYGVRIPETLSCGCFQYSSYLGYIH